jgi:hypothetical protein
VDGEAFYLQINRRLTWKYYSCKLKVLHHSVKIVNIRLSKLLSGGVADVFLVLKDRCLHPLLNGTLNASVERFRRHFYILEGRTSGRKPAIQIIDLSVLVDRCLDSTGWLKSSATHIKVFTGGCNSTQLDWSNKYTISLWVYKSPRRSRHVVSCSRHSVSCVSTSATGGHCRTLSDMSFLLNLPEWVYGHIFRFSSAKQIDTVTSGEPFPWHRENAGQKTFWPTLDVKRWL